MEKMESPAKSGWRGVVDYTLLDSIEAELGRALELLSSLSVGIESPMVEDGGETTASFKDALSGLDVWSHRLAELEQTTAQAESELHEQEATLREWFRQLSATSAQLERAANSTS
jgi:hypothetical protein